MKKLIYLLLAIAASACTHKYSHEDPWNKTLAYANNDYWRKRIPVSILNKANREIAGDIVAVEIGNKEGQAPLTGMPAEAVRVTTAKGDQLMYGIFTSDGKLFERGKIPESSRIYMPVECSTVRLCSSL
jgi:hypothetical protein